jgi:hypothetical protein
MTNPSAGGHTCQPDAGGVCDTAAKVGVAEEEDFATIIADIALVTVV